MQKFYRNVLLHLPYIFCFQQVLDSFNYGAPVSLPYSMVTRWTENFKNEIGKGAFGSVFSGIVTSLDGVEVGQRQDRRVAVKRVHAEGMIASQAIDDQHLIQSVKREINVLSSFHHLNIIRLVGYCLPHCAISTSRASELCLVYELAPLGGLNARLRDDLHASQLLWQQRLKIAVGVVKGLCYLHNSIPGCPAFHRDVKSGNVALMADHTPKIIDCGLSKYVPDSAEQGMTIQSYSGAKFGTLGYICPKYSRSAAMVYDAKCEIFSFGIVLLELVSGKLQGYKEAGVEHFHEDEQVVADHRITWPKGLALDIIKVAEECTALYNKRFVSMTEVMHRLVAINKSYHIPTPLESNLLRENSDLIAKVESMQLQQDVQAMRKVEATRKCECCFDDNIPESNGVTCSNPDHPHFFCGAEKNDCFGDMVTSQSGDLKCFERNSMGVVCACCTALAPAVISAFDASDIGRYCSAGAHAAFIKAKIDAVRHEGNEAMEKQRVLHMAEVQQLREAQIADENNRKIALIERHRQHIINNIITLLCPHCGVAVFDFDGCFAVEHRADDPRFRQGCGKFFCGWCFAKSDSNQSCHLHVKACRYNLHPGTYYGKFQEFNQVNGVRRRNGVAKYLQDNVADAKVREEIMEAIQRELSDN